MVSKPTLPNHQGKKNALNNAITWEGDGVTDGARTRDSQNHNLELYQLSYGHRLVRGSANILIFNRTRRKIFKICTKKNAPGPKPRRSGKRLLSKRQLGDAGIGTGV